MAGVDYNEFRAAVPASDGGGGGGGVQAVVTWAGALVSVALVAGLGLWGYRLMVRDVSGVPVVRALAGPMRLAPDDPGGLQADHQGLAVNRVAAEGEAARPADQVLLAPRPVSLTEEDMPRARLRPVPRAPHVAASAAPGDAAAVAAALALADQIAGGQVPPVPAPAAPVAAAADVVTSAPQPLASIAPATAADVVPAEIAAEIAAGIAGVTMSPRPMPRPAGDFAAGAATTAISADAAPAPVEEIAASAVVAGTNLVQLGAFDSTDVARAEWERLSSRFGSLLDGKQRIVQPATSGGRTFYRLRAIGFSDISDSRRFCAALMAEKADCIPVVAR